MSTWWDKEASEIQAQVRASERETQGHFLHSPDAVRTAVIHTREDVVLLVVHLSSINLQLSRIVKLLFVLVIVLFIIAVNVWTQRSISSF